MNNNEIEFDTQTGNPLPTDSIQSKNLSTIPTIEQNNTEFINNTQNESNNKTNNIKGKDFSFIIILFILILAIILFLFPLLK